MESEIIFGKNPVIESLKAGRSINKIMVADTLNKRSIDELITLAKNQGVIVQFVPKKKIEQLTGEKEKHQGIIAYVSAKNYLELDDLLNNLAKENIEPFLLILDGLEDPHNLGSILRTADALGINGIIIPKRRSVSLNATVAKTSVGAIEYVPVVRVNNLSQTIEELKKHGIWIAAVDMDGKIDITESKLLGPLALVLGSEGKGISRLVKEHCDFIIKIPMEGQINSLNVSVAMAIVTYEAYKQRRKK